MSSPTFGLRRHWRIIPVVFVTYSLAYLDRANFGFAAAAGMANDLHLSAPMSSLIGALFFLGYFCFQIPGAIFAERRSVKSLVFGCLILWGICATLTGLTRDASWLLLIRFLLGAFEAAVLPAMLIYIGRWFTRSERSKANSLLILGNPVTLLWMSVVSGYIVQLLDWRWMFILEGLPAIVWGGTWWITVSERPQDAPWLPTEGKGWLAAQHDAEQAGKQPYRNYREAFRQLPVLVLCVQYFCWSFGLYGFVLWLPSVVRQGTNSGMVAAGWLSAVPYALAIPAILLVAHFSDRSQERSRFVWPFLLVAAAAFYGSYQTAHTNLWLSYGLLCVAGAAMHAPFGVFFAMIHELLPTNVAGGAIALINSMGALGSFSGTYSVGYLNGLTGDPAISFQCMAAALLLAAALIVLIPKR